MPISYDIFQNIVKYSDEESLKNMSLLSKETNLLVRPKIAKFKCLNKKKKIKKESYLVIHLISLRN